MYSYHPEFISSQKFPENRYFWQHSGSLARPSPVLPGFENLGRLSANWRRFGTLSRPVATYFASPKPAVHAVCVSRPADPLAINSDLSPSGERIFARILTRATLIAIFIPQHGSVLSFEQEILAFCEFFMSLRISICISFFLVTLELSLAISIILLEDFISCTS